MKKVLLLVMIILCMGCTCLATDPDKDLDGKIIMTVQEMKQKLTETVQPVLYVREAENDSVTAYTDTVKVQAVAKLMVLDMVPDKIVYVFTNDKKLYKKLAGRLRYYAGRFYDFNGYRIMAEKEGAKLIDGKEVYRLWVRKVVRPKELIIHGDYPIYPPMSIGVWGWPGRHHRHCPPPPPMR